MLKKKKLWKLKVCKNHNNNENRLCGVATGTPLPYKFLLHVTVN